MIISSFAKIKCPLAILILTSSLGCASSPSTGTNSTQDRNPATHSASSGSGRQQEGHYDHQHDQDAPEGPVLGKCHVCTVDDVTDQDITNHKAYACSENHCIDTHCLAHQVKSLEIFNLEQVRELKSMGLSCCGAEGKCQQRISMETIEALLNPEDKKALDERLTKVEQSASSAASSQSAHTEVSKLSQEIEGAFNLCCPASGCGATLDKIQGCNAATCSDKTCEATFCYLCLKQTGSLLGLTEGTAEYAAEKIKAHDHVRLHSNDYWDKRPGFTERYHWQITRKKLKEVLKGVSPKERQKALEARKDLLEEKYFWPMPAGMETEAWIKVVQATPESTRKYYVYENHGQNQKKVRVEKTEALHTKERKIELLQNEYIFLTHEGDKKNAELVKLALQDLGGQVLASLDVRDGAQPLRQQVQPLAENESLHPVLGDEQVQVFRTLGAEQYRVGDLIWSSAAHKFREGRNAWDAPDGLNWDAAGGFCRGLGDRARLPTREEYEALGRAMGRPNNYDPDMIADMRGNYFWSSSPNGNNSAWGFNGCSGGVENYGRGFHGAVRCVRGR
ncbi:MAG: DUF1566 domain-containing protein [Bdellovibrionia bacterium]